ncbi:hypothetical protein ABZW67_19405 [Streptomyces rubiginosohelvolus]|uniref:hypothetical protein n=1 Tax=Streptomyces rubiginosohelvolus TaxID=67362 RepID=UPI0033A26ACB
MNATDLQRLPGYLRDHGLQVVTLEPELRLHVTDPMHGFLTQEIVTDGERYATSFHDDIGRRGREKECADLIAQHLAGSLPTAAGAS